MAKKGNNRFSEADLLAKGMKETFPGSGIYKPSKTGISTEFNGRDKVVTARTAVSHYDVSNNGTKFNKGILVDTLSVKNNEQFKANPISEWFIPYQVPSKKNCQKLYVRSDGKPGTTVSDRMKDYKNVTKMYWMIFGKEFKKAIDYYQLKFPLNVEFTFIRTNNQRLDYIGPGETVQDFMADKDFNWIPDDDTKHIKPFYGDIEINKQNPGVRIKLILK